MSSPRLVTAGSRTGAARAFARSLNILLKYVRLYGQDHKLSTSQFETAWRELRGALPPDPEGGFLFGVSGAKLLLDGVALETGPSERSFAQLLSAAGLASIYFSVQVSRDDFRILVDCFADAGARPAAIAAKLRQVFGNDDGSIRVNEIRYVPQDSSVPLTTRLAAQALGDDSEKFKDWLSDPEKLLQLIAAAEGEESADAGTGTGDGIGDGTGSTSGSGDSSGQVASDATGAPAIHDNAAKQSAMTPEYRRRGTPVLKQDDVTNVLKLLSQLGKVLPGSGGGVDAAKLREEVKNSPFSVRGILQTVLAQMATQEPKQSDPNLLLRIAEHLAIQFALERYEKGEVRVNAVREMLDKMGREIETLRGVLREHEEKMSRAGLMVESYTEVLDRQFWAAVPEQGKRSVLLSADAWCIPPRNIRDYLEELLKRGDDQLGAEILDNYSACIRSPEIEARRRTALGLSELAELYAQDSVLLRQAIERTGEQLQSEPAPEAQTLLGATLVRLTQEAGAENDFVAIAQALDCTHRLEEHRPELGNDVRRRIGVESRLRKFVVEAVQAPQVPPGFLDFLKREPRAAADELAVQYARFSRRDELHRIVEFACSLGPDAPARLAEILRVRPANEAASTIGLLTHLDPQTLRDWLPQRLPEWGRSVHDAVIRQIGVGAADQCASLLLELLDSFDPVILPEVMDEIGATDDPLATVRLLRLAEGELPPSASPYLQVKAIEALSRLQDSHAAPPLHQLLSARGLLGWKHPREIRIVAAQALMKIDPGFELPPNSGLSAAELTLLPLDPDPQYGWVRHRRYSRIVPDRALPASVETPRARCGVMINSISLGGGKGEREGRMNPGTEATLHLQLGSLRSLSSRVFVRDACDADEVAFEIIHIDLEDRSRLRRLLAEHVQSRGTDMGRKFRLPTDLRLRQTPAKG